MKLIILTCCLFSGLAKAEIFETTIQCTRQSNSTCLERTNVAFEKMGCHPVSASVKCHDAATDPLVDPAEIDHVRGKDFCAVKSQCHEPHYGNFGQLSCNWGTSGERSVDLSSADRGITLTVSVGFPSRFVRTLCH